MFNRMVRNLAEIRKEFFRLYKPNNIITEILPNETSSIFPIDQKTILKLHEFANCNSIYFKKLNIQINNLDYTSYEGDVNEYYLSAKKYDTNYQPFYPTWILSAFLLALKSKEFEFKEIIDIGAGDGRLPYCGALLQLRSIGIELDTNLTDLQKAIAKKTKIDFEILNTDAAEFDFSALSLTKPIFFVSGLPEMGEMLLENLIEKTKQSNFDSIGIVLLGNTVKRRFMSESTEYGWGKLLEKYNLKVVDEFDLPTHWTNDTTTLTKYLITQNPYFD